MSLWVRQIVTAGMPAVLTLCLLSSAWGQAADKQRASNELKQNHAGSFFEAAFLNLKAWRKGDVLVRIRKTNDTSSVDKGLGGGLLHSEKWIRLVFDYDDYRIGCFQRSEAEIINFEKTKDGFSPTEMKNQGWSAALVDREKDLIRFASNYGPRQTVPYSKLGKLSSSKRRLINSSISDFRGIICFAKHSFDSFNQLERMVFFNSTADANLFNVSKLENSTKVTMKTTHILGSEKRLTGKIKYLFDDDTMMPHSSESHLEVEEGVWSFLSSWDVVWARRGHLAVPEIMQVKIPERLPGGKSTGISTTEFKFHWFSIGEEVSEELFELAGNADFEEILEAVDPRKTKAKSFLRKASKD